jgi:hypothetical protein
MSPFAIIVDRDHVGAHKRRRAWAWWHRWPQHLRLSLLPASTPELHRRERVWRWLQEKRSGHRWGADWRTLCGPPPRGGWPACGPARTARMVLRVRSSMLFAQLLSALCAWSIVHAMAGRAL